MSGTHKTFIFDFDGTLADTFGIAVGVFRKFARKWHKTDDAAIERLRGMTPGQVFKELKLRWWHVPYIVYQGRKAVREQMGGIQAFPGTEAMLRALHADGHHLFIVSTNSNKNIINFLRRNKLEQYFKQTYGGSNLFNKARTLVKIVEQNNATLADCIYIGDEVRDIEAARKAGMQEVAVTWGYNNRGALEAAGADILIDKPAELLRLANAKPGRS